MTTEPPTDRPAPNGPTSKGPSGSIRTALTARLVFGVKLAAAIGALGAAFWLGTRLGAPTIVAEGPAPAGDVESWTCSMHPQIRQPRPGRCPICGMELVPAGRAEGTPAPKKVKYACAMMCVPPMDRPGKCPVCGMDMVAVQEHGGEDISEAAGAANAISEITLSETAQKLARLQTLPVERRFVAAEIRMVGKVAYDETRQRTITSRVPGRLDRLYVDYTGVPVNQGEHLVYLYSPELLGAQEELNQALQAFRGLPPDAAEDQRRLRTESLEAARQKLLLWGLTSEQVAEIEQRGTPSDHLTIYAPIGGIVTEKRLVEGAYVEEGTEIYTIADLSRVWVKLDAYELDLAWLRYGQSVEFTTEAYPGEVFQGTIAFIDPVLNARSRTAKVRLNVPNVDGRLKPEMFVRAVARSELTAEGQVMNPALAGKWICPMHPEVVADGPDSCTQCGMPLVPAESLGYATGAPADARPPLVIPATAPLITGKRAIVYVARQDRPGRYEGREVLLGPRAGDSYLVREGLAEGESVVAQGNLYLDSAVQILAKRSMMSPAPSETSPGHGPAGHAAPTGPGETAGAEQPDRATREVPRAAAESSERGRAALDGVFTSYFVIHKALSQDQLTEARERALQLLAVLEAQQAVGPPGTAPEVWDSLQEGLRKSVAGIAAAPDLGGARAAFEGASNALIALAKRADLGSGRRMFVYHCPMAFDNRGARWLQEKEGVENPYFGSAMFRCGVLKESIGGGGRQGQKGLDHD